MSMPSGYVRCCGCDFEGVMQRRPITLEYVLPGGGIVQGYRVFAWCTSCENITEAEREFDATLIQAEIESLKRRQVGFLSRLLGNGKVEDIELDRLQKKLQLARLRKSEPRCLRCGGTAITVLNFDEGGISSVVHVCGRRLFLMPEDPNAPRFAFKPEVIQLDPEGRKL